MEVTDLKFKKSKMLLGTMCALVLATTIGAFPSKAESAFDYNYYFWKYPDVANAVGFDPQALFNHYQTSGMAEGRYANQQAEWRAAAGHVDTAEERKAFLMTIPPADPNNADSDLPKLDPIYYYNTYDNHQISAVDMHKTNLDGENLSTFALVKGEQIYMQN